MPGVRTPEGGVLVRTGGSAGGFEWAGTRVPDGGVPDCGAGIGTRTPEGGVPACAGIGTFTAAIGREIGPGFGMAAASAALFFSGCLPSATNEDSSVIGFAIAM